MQPITLQSKRYNYFYQAVAVCLFFLAVAFIFILAYGKTGSFLFINSRYNSFLDIVFTYFTYLGDALVWAPLLLYCILRKKEFVIPVILGLVISTIITQFSKRVIYPDEMRPIIELKAYGIHTIKGVFINHIHSFPSGHTATAFTLCLLLSFMLGNRWAAYLLPLLALGVGYSRVYQGQHFVTDVAAGMLIGILSGILSILLSQRFFKTRPAKLYK